VLALVPVRDLEPVVEAVCSEHSDVAWSEEGGMDIGGGVRHAKWANRLIAGKSVAERHAAGERGQIAQLTEVAVSVATAELVKLLVPELDAVDVCNEKGRSTRVSAVGCVVDEAATTWRRDETHAFDERLREVIKWADDIKHVRCCCAASAAGCRPGAGSMYCANIAGGTLTHDRVCGSLAGRGRNRLADTQGVGAGLHSVSRGIGP